MDRAPRKLEIPISETLHDSMSVGEVKQAKEKETRLAEQDKIVEQTKEKKNALESYVYETRNKVPSDTTLYFVWSNLIIKCLYA